MAQPTLSQVKIRRVATDASLAVLALALSFVEAVLPLQSLVPLPGFKLGLANIAVTYAFFSLSPYDAAAVSLVRLMLSALYFGTPMSFGFSLSGAALSFASMYLSAMLCGLNKKPSWFGVSVISSASHNLGQLLFSVCVFGQSAVSYAPWLLVLSVPTGLLTGALLCAVIPLTEKFSCFHKS